MKELLVIFFIIAGIYVFWSQSSPDNYYAFSDALKPTLQEVNQFVINDTTNENLYVDGSYMCAEFSTDVINHAKELNYRVGFVTLSNLKFDTAHAVVCFDTTNGICFLEPQTDTIFSREKMDDMRKRGSYDLNANESYFMFAFDNYKIEWK
jgi:hypothetical protein